MKFFEKHGSERDYWKSIQHCPEKDSLIMFKKWKKSDCRRKIKGLYSQMILLTIYVENSMKSM